MTARVVAIDPSLTSTGVAEFCVDDHGNGSHRTWTVTSTGRAHASWAQRGARLCRLRDRLVGDVLGRLDDGMPVAAPAVVLFEGHANGMAGDPFDRYGLWWLTFDALREYDVPVGVVEPKTIKKFATGKGNSTKLQVVSHMSRRWPLDMIETDDEWDALAAAEIAAHRVGIPVPGQKLTADQKSSLGAVAWPDGLRTVTW